MGNVSHKIIGIYVMNSRLVILLLDSTVEGICFTLFYCKSLW